MFQKIDILLEENNNNKNFKSCIYLGRGISLPLELSLCKCGLWYM